MRLPPPLVRTDFAAVKNAIHRRLIQKLNLDKFTEVNREQVRREVGQILESLVVGESTPMNLQERERLGQEVHSVSRRYPSYGYHRPHRFCYRKACG